MVYKWHFILVVFADPGNGYSISTDTLAMLKMLPKNLNTVVDLYIDEVGRNPIVCRWESGNMSCENLTQNPLHSTVIADFFSRSIATVKSDHRIFAISCHGNSFYYRHNTRVYDVGTLLRGVSLCDIIFLSSCHLATLETAFELKDKCRYFVSSAGYKSKATFIPSEILSLNLDPLQMSLALAKGVVSNLNGMPDESLASNRIGDISVVDTAMVESLTQWLCRNFPNLNQVPFEVWRAAKLHRMWNVKRDEFNACYDLWTFCRRVLSGEKFAEFDHLFQRTVIFHAETAFTFSVFRGRCHGLSWCPCPWDLKWGSYYKNLKIFPHCDRLTIK